MRDVGSQLAEYFEAATERIDAEDVLAHLRVAEQAQRPVRRRLRPAWVAAAAFLGGLLLVGGALLAGALLHDPLAVEPQPVGTPVAAPHSGWGWWPLVVAVAAVVISAVLLVSRRLRRATKEVDMQTLDEKQRKATEPRETRRSRRAWFIGVAFLVVLAGAIATWAIIEANQGDDLAIATHYADVEAIAATTADGESLAALFTEDGVYVRETGVPYTGRDAIAGLATGGGYYTEWQHGDVKGIGDGVFTYPIEFIFMGADYTGEMRITVDGDLISYAEVVRWELVDE